MAKRTILPSPEYETRPPNVPRRQSTYPYHGYNRQMFNGVIPEIYKMKVRFVDAALKTLESRRIGYDVYDPEGTGLVLRVSPHGKKTWVVNYRSTGGIKQQRRIGRFPVMRVADARDAAQLTLGDIQDEGV